MACDAPNSLVVSNDLSELARVTAWVHAWTQRHQIPVRTVERVDLCSSEVVINIMTHAYAGHGIHQISLRLDSQPDGLALEIQDDGCPFDPRQAVDPPQATTLEDAKTSGWGIPIFRHFSDELHYRRADGRNHLTLIFQSPPLLQL
jgi:anti-sigma regulatory factor (Ser/Thr protein kinase)